MRYLIATGLLTAILFATASAQEPVVLDGAAAAAAIAQQQAIQAAQAGQPVPGQSGQPIPGQPGAKPGTPGAKPGAGKAGKDKKSKPATPMIVTRGSKPEDIKNSEAILRRTPTGKVSFSFVGAKWLKVLEVVAAESAMTLDWQELPGDYLNLVTRRDYSIAEARNVINRHLLTRGYTMLTEGETLHVVKLDKLNKANVPRVAPEELDSRPDYEFVKVSFKLNWLVAQEAVAELSSYKSKNGSLVHMSATNRIEAVDTVKNLKDIRDMLAFEQSTEGQEKLIKVFPLKHRRASEVIDLVRELMDIEKKSSGGKSGGSGMNMQMMQQMQRQMQQMAQMAQANKGKGAKGAEPVSLVLNQRENSILAKAPPDKMAEIEQAITKLDVENDRANSLMNNINKYKIYRLETFEPQPLVDMLNELGDLAPQTQLRVDDEQGAIIAYATLADHMTINTLIEKLDSAARRFEVLQLRRLEADFVSGTIRFLMGKGGEDEKESRNNSYMYGWGGYGYGGGQQKKDKTNEFRVDADVVNNRLLLFASEMELEQIEDLLTKLGEIPAKDSRESRRRLIDIDPDTDPEEFLRRVQQLWPKDNRLNISPVPDNLKKQPKPEPGQEDETKKDDEQKPDSKNTKPDADNTKKPAITSNSPDVAKTGTSTNSRLSVDEYEFFAVLTQPQKAITAEPNVAQKPATEDKQTEKSDQLTPQQQAIKELFERNRARSGPPRMPANGKSNPATDEPPPVNISFTPSGRLMITSDDPAALNDMEEILLPFTKSRKRHVVYKLKYASPGWIAATLREYFEDEEDSEPVLDWWGDVVRQKKQNNGRLSARTVPRFISDSYSSTLLVKGADAKQLKTIENLIEMYDTPEPNDSRSVRVTEMFPIKYSKASVMANVIKDVYRDLLSANDKALQKDDKGSVEREVTYIRNSGSDEADDSETPIRFKGLLSVGTDEVSNTLIVSSSSGLMESIREMVTKLDLAAAPTSRVKVIPLDSRFQASQFEKQLGKILAPTTRVAKQGQQPPKNGQPAQPNANQGQK